MTFDKPLLERGCCGASLRGSTILAGYICLIIGIFGIIASIAAFSYGIYFRTSALPQKEISKLSLKQGKNKTVLSEQEQMLNALVAANIGNEIIGNAVGFFFSSICYCILTLLMIRGIHKGSPLWIIPWLTWLMSDMISLTAFTLTVTLTDPHLPILVVVGISFAISTLFSYFIAIGYSHFQELLQSRSNRCLRSDGGTIINV